MLYKYKMEGKFRNKNSKLVKKRAKDFPRLVQEFRLLWNLNSLLSDIFPKALIIVNTKFEGTLTFTIKIR